MAPTPGPVATPCPLCEYDLAALPGTPPSAGGIFSADVTCPECGIAVPAGGRVIEGALHPLSLRPNSRAMIVVLAMNVLFFVLIATQVIDRGFRGGPGGAPNVAPWMLIQAAAMGCVVVTLGWEVWRRSRFARRSASEFLAGREIRWIVGPTGLECIDRSKPLKRPKRTRIEAARVYRVTGTAEDPAAAASASVPASWMPTREGANDRQPAMRLVVWSWTADGNGCRVDLAPLAVFTLGERAGEVAADLARILGLPPEAASRPLPWAPFADQRTWLRFFKMVMIGATVVVFVGMAFVPRDLMMAWVLCVGLVAGLTVRTANAAINAARRRWVRARSSAP